MNIYTIGDARTIVFELRRNGKRGESYANATSMEASFINFKYRKLRSSIVTGLSNTTGADWTKGIAAFNFSVGSTAGITDGEILKVRIKVTIEAEILTFYSVADYKFIANAV